MSYRLLLLCQTLQRTKIANFVGWAEPARLGFYLFLVLAGGLLSTPVHAAQSDQEAKLDEVNEVLDAIIRIPEQSVPPVLMSDVRAIAVIPKVIKLGLVIGGRYGKGVVSVRLADGGWSRPAFLSITGGSVGWQIGAQSTDVVLMFKSPKGVLGLADGKFTLGVDASVAAGRVGRQASAATDLQPNAEIYSYSRSRGLFAGIDLDGTALRMEHSDNHAYYRQPDVKPEQIFNDDTRQLPASAQRLKVLLGKMTEN